MPKIFLFKNQKTIMQKYFLRNNFQYIWRQLQPFIITRDRVIERCQKLFISTQIINNTHKKF